jgi:hypothetical protein
MCACDPVQSCLQENNPTRLANVVAVGKVRVGCLKRADFLALCGNLQGLMNREFNRKAIAGVALLNENLTRTFAARASLVVHGLSPPCAACHAASRHARLHPATHTTRTA